MSRPIRYQIMDQMLEALRVLERPLDRRQFYDNCRAAETLDQISKCTARLRELGLIEKQTEKNGVPAFWTLTDAGMNWTIGDDYDIPKASVEAAHESPAVEAQTDEVNADEMALFVAMKLLRELSLRFDEVELVFKAGEAQAWIGGRTLLIPTDSVETMQSVINAVEVVCQNWKADDLMA